MIAKFGIILALLSYGIFYKVMNSENLQRCGYSDRTDIKLRPKIKSYNIVPLPISELRKRFPDQFTAVS